MKANSEPIDFIRGYLCAVVALIRDEGMITPTSRELYRAGVGRLSISQLRSIGVDRADLEIIERYFIDLQA